MTWKEFEASLHSYTTNQIEAIAIRAKVLAGVGDYYYWENDLSLAYEHYLRSLQDAPWSLCTYVKCALIRTGILGVYTRGVLGA